MRYQIYGYLPDQRASLPVLISSCWGRRLSWPGWRYIRELSPISVLTVRWSRPSSYRGAEPPIPSSPPFNFVPPSFAYSSLFLTLPIDPLEPDQQYLHRISKNVLPSTCYNLDIHDPIAIIFMAALCNRGAIIFLPCDFYLSIYLSFFFLFFLA